MYVSSNKRELYIFLLQKLTKLCYIATECVTALAADPVLQIQLLKAGALWHLLLFMFKYDYTLDEGGVEKTEDENRQEISNRLAKEAVRSCARLGGYLQGELESPENPVTQKLLNKLLTPYLANKLSENKPEEVNLSVKLTYMHFRFLNPIVLDIENIK